GGGGDGAAGGGTGEAGRRVGGWAAAEPPWLAGAPRRDGVFTSSLPSPGRGDGSRSGRPVAGPAAGGAPGSLHRGTATDQEAGVPRRDVAAATGLPRPAVPVGLAPAPVPLATESWSHERTEGRHGSDRT